MKRSLALILMTAMLLTSLVITPAAAARPGEAIGNVLYSDVVAYIDGYPIRSYNIGGNTYIIVEDLMNYGFSVQWKPNVKKLVIDTNRTAQPSGYTATYTPEKNTHPAGTVAMQYLYTEITTWIGSDKVTSYNVGGFTCICMDDLAKYFKKEYVWDAQNVALRLTSGNYLTSCDRNGHKYRAATCTSAQTCSICEKTFGEALGHTTQSGQCSRCGMTFFENKQYSGYGQKVLTGINIPKGAYQASMSHKGNSNFAIWLYTGSGSRKQLLVNEIGNYQGTVAIEDKIENGYLEIEADGQWSIVIEQLTQTGTANLSGRGDCVSPLFTLPQGIQIISMKHNGSSNFAIWLFDDTGARCDLLANEIGGFSGQVIFNEAKQNRKYFISVIADGEWSIDFGLGQSLTRCTAGNGLSSQTGTLFPNIPAQPSTPGVNNNSQWDISGLMEYMEYINNASNAATTSLEYVTKAIDPHSSRVSSYMQYSQKYASEALTYLKKARTYVQSNRGFELSGHSYTSIDSLIGDAISQLDAYIGSCSSATNSSNAALASFKLVGALKPIASLLEINLDLLNALK